MQFSDLPNGGHNLRLYTYDPIGSQYGPPNTASCPGIWIYNTGHFDIALGVPCSQADPQGFCTWDAMSAYAGTRGESLVMVARADLQTLCAYRAPVQIQVGAPILPKPGGTIPTSGGIGTSTIVVSGIGGGSGVITPGVIPSPGTPIDQGGVPGGVGNPATPAVTLPLLRFILYDPSSDPHKPYATGANYNGCSQVNTANCKAMNFVTQQAAIDFAEANGEIPYQVLSANEPWGIIVGTIPLDPSRFLGKSATGIPWTLLAAGAALLWFLSGR
jgi:hypothetical protein